MATRPLTGLEIADIRRQLVEAKERQRLANQYIMNLEQQLCDGTAWCYEHEAFIRVCKEIEKQAAERRRQDEEQEVAQYGRTLTSSERRGWAIMPARNTKGL